MNAAVNRFGHTPGYGLFRKCIISQVVEKQVWHWCIEVHGDIHIRQSVVIHIGPADTMTSSLTFPAWTTCPGSSCNIREAEV